jgi:hypothetical protein
MPTPTRNRPSGEAERIAERRHQALNLRKAGASYRTIAAKTGVNVANAHRDVMHELQALAEQTRERAEDVLALELRRLDDATLALMPAVQRGDVRAIQALVQVMDRRSRYLALDAPKRTEISGPEGGPIPIATIARVIVDVRTGEDG